jgi:DNA polymerase-3 subunit alpha (Gram-positive type)
MVADAPYIETEIKRFVDFSENLPLVGHNLMFDYSFLKVNAVNNRLSFERKGIDTLKIARLKLKELPSKKLDFLCGHFGIPDENHHRAVNDAKATYELYKILCKNFENENEVFEPYDLIYKAKKQSPITDKQIKYLKDLVSFHHINIDYEVDKLTKSQASRIIDNIILEYGRIF